MEKAPIVRLRGVTKRFDDVVAVDSLNLDIFQGEFLTLLGPSGCGKTTVLRLIAGFESLDQGEIIMNGTSLGGTPPNKRNVNTVFQSYALFPHMTIFDNIAFGLRMKQLDRSLIRKEVGEALSIVKLSGMEERKPHQLSGGQQQRVAMARAIVNKPQVLLLDEPSAGLSPQRQDEAFLRVSEINKAGVTTIMVEQNARPGRLRRLPGAVDGMPVHDQNLVDNGSQGLDDPNNAASLILGRNHGADTHGNISSRGRPPACEELRMPDGRRAECFRNGHRACRE